MLIVVSKLKVDKLKKVGKVVKEFQLFS